MSGGCGSSGCNGNPNTKEYYRVAQDILGTLRKEREKGPIVIQGLDDTNTGTSHNVEINPEDLSRAFKSAEAVTVRPTNVIVENGVEKQVEVDFKSYPATGHTDFYEPWWTKHWYDPDLRYRMVLHELLMLASKGDEKSKYNDYNYRTSLTDGLMDKIRPELHEGPSFSWQTAAGGVVIAAGVAGAAGAYYALKSETPDTLPYEWKLGEATAHFEANRNGVSRVLIRQNESDKWEEVWKGKFKQLPVSPDTPLAVQKKMIAMGIEPIEIPTGQGSGAVFVGIPSGNKEAPTKNSIVFMGESGKTGVYLSPYTKDPEALVSRIEIQTVQPKDKSLPDFGLRIGFKDGGDAPSLWYLRENQLDASKDLRGYQWSTFGGNNDVPLSDVFKIESAEGKPDQLVVKTGKSSEMKQPLSRMQGPSLGRNQIDFKAGPLTGAPPADCKGGFKKKLLNLLKRN